MASLGSEVVMDVTVRMSSYCTMVALNPVTGLLTRRQDTPSHRRKATDWTEAWSDVGVWPC
jgi:hypothetical protein